MKAYFIDPDSRRLRAGWRILAFFLIFIAIAAAVMVATRTILGSLRRGSDLQIVLVGIAATAAVFIARTFLDKKTLTSLGLKWDGFAVPDLLSGFLNSALVMAGIYFVMLGANLIEFHGFNWWADGSAPGADVQALVFPVVLAILFKLAIVAW